MKTNSTARHLAQLALTGVVAWLVSAPGLASALTIYAIKPGNVLIAFDSSTPETVITIGPVTGLGANETIRGIDFRPFTRQLYASTVAAGSANNSVVHTYTLDPETGVASLVGSTAAPLAGAGDVATGYDFNPVVDRIRYVNTNDENARLVPNTGALAGNDTDLTPPGVEIIAAAYDRNNRNPFNPPVPPNPLTTLYVIDRTNSQLGTQGGIDGTPSPNGGVITSVGPLGISLATLSDGCFDITSAPGSGFGQGFAALTDGATDLTGLYTINLLSGAVTLVGLIGDGATQIGSCSVVIAAEAVGTPLLSLVGLLAVAAALARLGMSRLGVRRAAG